MKYKNAINALRRKIPTRRKTYCRLFFDPPGKVRPLIQSRLNELVDVNELKGSLVPNRNRGDFETFAYIDSLSLLYNRHMPENVEELSEDEFFRECRKAQKRLDEEFQQSGESDMIVVFELNAL